MGGALGETDCYGGAWPDARDLEEADDVHMAEDSVAHDLALHTCVHLRGAQQQAETCQRWCNCECLIPCNRAAAATQTKVGEDMHMHCKTRPLGLSG